VANGLERGSSFLPKLLSPFPVWHRVHLGVLTPGSPHLKQNTFNTSDSHALNGCPMVPQFQHVSGCRHLTLEAVDSFRSANFHHVQSKDTNQVAELPKINSLNTRLVPIPNVHAKRAFNFRRQCRAAVLSRFLYLARWHCRPLSLSISPLSHRSALERLS